MEGDENESEILKRSDNCRHVEKSEVDDREVLEKRNAVCAFDCDCGKVYIGETGRTLKTRMDEHKAAVNKVRKTPGFGLWNEKGEGNEGWKGETGKGEGEI